MPGRSPAVVTAAGQLAALCLDQAAMFVLCFDGKCVLFLSEILVIAFDTKSFLNPLE